MKRSKWIWLLNLVLACGCWLLSTPTALADSTKSDQASALFTAECAGCHVNGGNIIRRRKTLKLRALQRNGVDSIEAIASLVTNGKGIMSAYGDRLSPEAIDLLAHYVWDQAQNNWR